MQNLKLRICTAGPMGGIKRGDVTRCDHHRSRSFLLEAVVLLLLLLGLTGLVRAATSIDR